MRLGRVELLLVVLILLGGVYMAIQYFPKNRNVDICAPVPLSPEVRAYIDKKLAEGSGMAQCGEMPALVTRIAEMESKVNLFDKFRDLRQQVDAKRAEVDSALEQQRESLAEVTQRRRNEELQKLKGDTAMLCAGVTVRAVTPGLGGANRNFGGGAGGGGQGGGGRGRGGVVPGARGAGSGAGN